MFRHLSRHKKGWVFILLLAVWALSGSPAVFAHSPHDVIDVVAISPNYDWDQTVFIVIEDYIQKSTDGGYSWKKQVNGLDNRYRLSSLAISPEYERDGTVFAAGDGDGLYRSENGGSSWEKINQGLDSLEMGLVSISPEYGRDRMVLAAGSKGGLYRTVDGGESWQAVMGPETRVGAIGFGDGGEVWLGTGAGELQRSLDGGGSWVKVKEIAGSGGITALGISPEYGEDQTVYVGTEQGLLRTVDGGATFAEMNEGLGDRRIRSIVLLPGYGEEGRVLVSTWSEGVYETGDRGEHWVKCSEGLTTDKQADTEQYRSPHFRDLKLSPAFNRDNVIFLGGFDGLFKSVDGGHSWLQLETLPLRLIKGLGVSPSDKDKSTLVLTTYGGGAYVSIDEGWTWSAGNKGLGTTRLIDVVFSPDYLADRTIFSGASGVLLKSMDSGNSWTGIQLYASQSWLVQIEKTVRSVSGYSIGALLRKFGLPDWVSDSFSGGGPDPYPTVVVVSPGFAVDRALYFGTREHGVFKSVDGGLDSTIVLEKPGEVVVALVISPDFTSDRTLFAGVRGEGIYKTADGGETWQPVNNGLTFIFANIFQSSAPNSDIKLAISPDYGADKTVFAGSAEGLYRTTDGGASWQRLEALAEEGTDYVIGLGLSPDYRADQTLLVSLKGRGLFKSEDGGRSFDQIGIGPIQNYPLHTVRFSPGYEEDGLIYAASDEEVLQNYALEMIRFSPEYGEDGLIYAASDEEVFRSTDRGESWTILERPVRYENMREVIRYEGSWKVLSGTDYSAASVAYSAETNSRAMLSFVGTGVTWIGTSSASQGMAKVYLDGEYEGEVDQYSAGRTYMVEAYRASGLEAGPHTITIEVTGARNPAASGHGIVIDAFDVIP